MLQVKISKMLQMYTWVSRFCTNHNSHSFMFWSKCLSTVRQIASLDFSNFFFFGSTKTCKMIFFWNGRFCWWIHHNYHSYIIPLLVTWQFSSWSALTNSRYFMRIISTTALVPYLATIPHVQYDGIITSYFASHTKSPDSYCMFLPSHITTLALLFIMYRSSCLSVL
jgi:hypothetical protein